MAFTTAPAPEIGPSRPDATGGPVRGSARRGGLKGFVSAVPAWVWGAALAAALVHMAPYWRAASETPDGWSFAANLSVSPDYMQYRVWMRQTQVEGPIVTNTFTTEPNRPYLPVGMYWSLGGLARLTGMSPEWTYAYAGAAVAFAFVVLLFVVVRRFLGGGPLVAWTMGALLLGGGLGGYLKLFGDFEVTRNNYWIDVLLLRPLAGPEGAVIFEDFRGNYIVQALFDTHFLTFWLVTTLAVFALYGTLRRFTPLRLAGTAALFAFGTLLHVYEGLTLLVIAGSIVALSAVKRMAPARTLLLTMAALSGAVVLTILPIWVLVKQSGLPAPTWRGETLVFSVLVLSYPVAFGLLLWGFGRYWRDADLERVFLVGWALGCAALTLAGPFFPYPDRGTMTLQIPLYIIGAGIWFSRRPRVGWAAATVLVLLLGSTAANLIRTWQERTEFDAAESHKWLSADHARAIAPLRGADRTDVLVADQPNLRWLAPEYPGLHYAGHFFLTVDFTAKQAELTRFYGEMDTAERRAFLDRWGADWLFVDDAHDAAAFAAIPGVRTAAAGEAGTLFHVDPAGAAAR